MNRGKGAAAEGFSFTGKLKPGSLVNNLRTVTWKLCNEPCCPGGALSHQGVIFDYGGLVQQAATFKLVSRFIIVNYSE